MLFRTAEIFSSIATTREDEDFPSVLLSIAAHGDRSLVAEILLALQVDTVATRPSIMLVGCSCGSNPRLHVASRRSPLRAKAPAQDNGGL